MMEKHALCGKGFVPATRTEVETCPSPGVSLVPSDGAWLGELLSRLGDGLSEYCFANLYLFRNVHRYRLLRGEHSFISGRTYDGRCHLMPLFDLAEAEPRYLQDALQGYDFFYPISEATVAKLDPHAFVSTYNQDDSDYVYAAEKFAKYRGTKLSKKRNLMKQFLTKGDHSAWALTPELADDARVVLDLWQEAVGKPPKQTDYEACVEALENLEGLKLFGFLHYLDGEPVGFVLGKEIQPRMYAMHFAKGKREVKGIFQHMFNHFANHFAKEFNWFNFEQDMGIINFRKTKRSYAPDWMLNKYRVTLTTHSPV